MAETYYLIGGAHVVLQRPPRDDPPPELAADAPAGAVTVVLHGYGGHLELHATRARHLPYAIVRTFADDLHDVLNEHDRDRVHSVVADFLATALVSRPASVA